MPLAKYMHAQRQNRWAIQYNSNHDKSKLTSPSPSTLASAASAPNPPTCLCSSSQPVAGWLIRPFIRLHPSRTNVHYFQPKHPSENSYAGWAGRRKGSCSAS